ncbi:MAG TPA: iron-only hydrogenase system regulator [Syntrophomonadaceae bacterium]|jgi:putative iron-only hydrogenase system regulator|nr:iron-only hydrogenase system regulator [Syntrophomonadaceae bacterium]HRX21539.1 iron-only hydrogenase system regulator [Syntrophomonadaceae bacterium]
MEKRLGFVGIVIEDRSVAPQVNAILSDHAEMIIGRMGLPNQAEKAAIISLIVDGTTDEIGAMTGKLGNLKHVTVKSALTKNN